MPPSPNFARPWACFPSEARVTSGIHMHKTLLTGLALALIAALVASQARKAAERSRHRS